MAEPKSETAQHEIEDLWWLHDSFTALIEGKSDNDTLRVGLIRSTLATTRPLTMTTHPRVVTPPGGDQGGEQ